MHDDQPQELRAYLTEADALVTEWHSREGLEDSHLANLDMMATLAVLQVIMSSERSFDDLRAAVLVYLTAAFQMGRATHDDGCSDSR